MSRFHSYLSSACKIIESYRDGKPFSFHLKRALAAEKKFGSRDRKAISTLCYAYFRMGHAWLDKPCSERIPAGLFLSTQQSNEVLLGLEPDFGQRVSLPVIDKLFSLGILPREIFPFTDELSPEVDADEFTCSFLTQPDVFLRVRPGKFKQVAEKLSANQVNFIEEDEHCLRILDKSSPLDAILKLNEEAVVQDINSQKVFEYLSPNPAVHGYNIPRAWDCCAASGGKSILLFDLLNGEVRLTVSDIRKQILSNLSERLEQAKVPVDQVLLIDLSTAISQKPPGRFSIIVCDAPCSGSGTWSRTPEQLYHFTREMILAYSARQKKIVTNSCAYLQTGGLFFYITCSVFRKENEEIVEFITTTLPLQLVESRYNKGYCDKADTLFVAVFKRI